jgi:hypothetical protein
MALNSIYSKYFQKSKVFLYPLLGIKRGTSVVPSETYISWDGIYSSEDMKFICIYKSTESDNYEFFYRGTLLKHTRLHDYINMNDDTAVFVFDFSDLGRDWTYFIEGRYSQISKNLKHEIINFFERNSGNYLYMHSYLFPEKHFENYADILGVRKEILEEVGELCNKPDLNKENLILPIANLQDLNISKLNLQNK